MYTSSDLEEFGVVTTVKRLAKNEHSAALASHIVIIMKFGAGAEEDPFRK